MFEKENVNESKKPDYVSNMGIQIWKNLDKNGKEYLSVRIPIMNIRANCFKLEQEVKEEIIPDE